MRGRLYTFAALLVCVLILTIALAGCVSVYSENETEISQKDKTRNEIIQMQREIVSLRQQNLADQEKMSEYGRGNIADFMKARSNLSEARIKLAKFQDRRKAVISELENLIQTYSDMRESLQKEITAGQRPTGDLNDLEIAILEAKIRLAKAKQ